MNAVNFPGRCYVLVEMLTDYCTVLYSPCSNIRWTQATRLHSLTQQTNSWDQGGLLRGAEEIIEGYQQCFKRCVWTDHHLEQYQCYWERSKGDAENHKEMFREQNSLVFRLTRPISCKRGLKGKSLEGQEIVSKHSPLESGNICLCTGDICQKTETFLIWSSSLYIFRFEMQASYINPIQKWRAFSNTWTFWQ